MATPLRLIVLCIAFLVRRFFQPDVFSLLRVSQPGRDLRFLNNLQGYGMRLWASPCGPRRYERSRQAVSALRVSAADACKARLQPAMPVPLSLFVAQATIAKDATPFRRGGCVPAHLTRGYLSSALTRPLL